MDNPIPEKQIKNVICPLCGKEHPYSDRLLKNLCMDCVDKIGEEFVQFNAEAFLESSDAIVCPLCGTITYDAGFSSKVCALCAQAVYMYRYASVADEMARAILDKPYTPYME